MRNIYLILMAVLGLSLYWLSELSLDEQQYAKSTMQIAALAESVETYDNKDEIPDKIGVVKIIHKVSDSFYPSYWKNDPKIKPVATEADHKELLRTIPL